MVQTMIWQTASSTTPPELLDITSSPYYVYIRKDVVEHEPDENGVIMYTYDEMLLTPSEYELYNNLATTENTIKERISDVEAMAFDNYVNILLLQ